jgi:amidase
MNEFDLRGMQAGDVARAVRSGELRATAIAEAQWAAIERDEPAHGAYIVQFRDESLRAAERLDTRVAAGESLGPLAGVPMALKDIYDMNGVATTAGMGIHRDSIAERDATVVTRLKQADAVILGKVTLTEGVYAEHREAYPAPINPWRADHWAGASSTGTGVAMAAGLAVAALGSETGGSIKLPAAVNGVTAVKPTWSRVSRYGVFELAATLDHAGPFARSVSDAATLLGVIAGSDPLDPTASQVAVPDYSAAVTRGVGHLRIGIDSRWTGDGVDAETLAALEAAVGVLAAAGATIEDIRVPDVSDMIWDWFGVCAAQTALAHAETFPARRNEYGPALTQLLDMGNELSATDYQKLLLRREIFRGEMNALFTGIDLLAIPVLAFPAPSLERMAAVDDELIAGLHRFTCPFNMSGQPGIVLPCGFNSAGMPIVFQLVGRHFDEPSLFAAGGAYQAATDWHTRRPAEK